MGYILDEIVAFKRIEVEQLKQTVSIQNFMESPYYYQSPHSLSTALSAQESSGVIAEFKRKSPSKGWIHADADVSVIVNNYAKAGVSGISCLTDSHFFGGSKEDFQKARTSFNGPILRKDFMIDPFQIHEAKSMGADVVLLIASILTKEEIIKFTDLAHELKMEILLELHEKEELPKIYEEVDMIGVNNRNLKNFTVSIDHSIEMKSFLPQDKVLISESGLDSIHLIKKLHNFGYRGFLMGEHFMKNDSPGKEAKQFIDALFKLHNKGYGH